ncbi:serine/threonine protein phosphatase [Actinoplanes sp. NPDC048796]|uniref:serine/threonine protein phosphatase n=1 Tax=unclassified Actinoplanes TaxID=2626549 RepID=UPI0033C4372C
MIAFDALDDAELASLLRSAPAGAAGVGGGSSVIDADGVPVFAKRIPITDRELAHPHSTANLFDLPLACQYGMHRLPGPGFGAWRELAANTIMGSPTLYHWRVLPGRPPVAPEHRDIDAVVTQFGGSPAVRTRFEELAAATHSLVLFFEYLPHPASALLTDPVAVERQLFEIVAALRTHDMLHMDAHFDNMRTDGTRLHLVDYGLATSPHFELSEAERDFVTRHAGHDADYAAMRLVNWLATTACGVPSAPAIRNAHVLRYANGDIPATVPAPVAGILTRHAAAAARMNSFCYRLYDGEDVEYGRPRS